ncbi:uncharacterized protein [Panulirus ornatus]|uniref:uncharacterized protein n=1 Tax=Panulirus ornatus TaxID=150431 RepID=UPI003A8A546D
MAYICYKMTCLLVCRDGEVVPGRNPHHIRQDFIITHFIFSSMPGNTPVWSPPLTDVPMDYRPARELHIQDEYRHYQYSTSRINTGKGRRPAPDGSEKPSRVLRST